MCTYLPVHLCICQIWGFHQEFRGSCITPFLGNLVINVGVLCLSTQWWTVIPLDPKRYWSEGHGGGKGWFPQGEELTVSASMIHSWMNPHRQGSGWHPYSRTAEKNLGVNKPTTALGTRIWTVSKAERSCRHCRKNDLFRNTLYIYLYKHTQNPASNFGVSIFTLSPVLSG